MTEDEILLLKKIYMLLATEEANRIIDVLIKEKQVTSSELQLKSQVSASKFYNYIKDLTNCLVLDKKIGNDRSVSYSISPFGKNVLKLSEPLFELIKKEYNKMERSNSG